MEMVPIYHIQVNKVNLHDFNEVEYIQPNKHIWFESSPSFEEK